MLKEDVSFIFVEDGKVWKFKPTLFSANKYEDIECLKLFFHHGLLK